MLDSPFVMEPSSASMPNPSLQAQNSEVPTFSFEKEWLELEGHNTRGWCSSSVEEAMRLIQGLGYQLRVTAVDQPPFTGEVKILVVPHPSSYKLDSGERPGHAALRLKAEESEDKGEESCLWRLRCKDARLRGKLQALLVEDDS